MLFADVVATSLAVGATRARGQKIRALAELLAALPPEDVVATVGFLTGEPRQGSIGIGWAMVGSVDVPGSADVTPTITVAEVDELLSTIQTTTGAGSASARRGLLADIFGRATPDEVDFLRRLLIGELRQGALAGLMADAVAKAAAVPAPLVRRAAMLSGDLAGTAVVALAEGAPGLEATRLVVGRPVLPMLAATAEDVAAATAEMGAVSVEWKLDGVRVQVHRRGADIGVFTRNLNDVTDRVPEVVALVRSFSAEHFVLDGEVIGLLEDERPHAFQDTMSRVGTGEVAPEGHAVGRLAPFFFDVLHIDGRDLIDEPLVARAAALSELVGMYRIPAVETDDPDEAARFGESALAAGHEGVMVKQLDSPYLAGRRGKAWRKVKPVHTLDLVVLAVEWGSGRRQGWLSNLHLGALDPEGRYVGSGLVMVGKTFKGLTDEMLTWQTERFLELETSRDGHVVHIEPAVVVEIALDGVQVSTRYPGGVALRFARVRRYREDKDPKDADTIGAVRSLGGLDP